MLTQQSDTPLNNSIAERATAFLQPEFCDLIAGVYGCTVAPLPLPHMGLPLVAYKVRRPWKREVVLAPYNFQPVLRSRNEDIIRALIDVADGLGAKWSVKARLHHKLSHQTEAGFGLVFSEGSVETLVSLKGGFDAVVARMQPRQRSKWRKALRESNRLVVAPFGDDLILRQFHNQLIRTYRDKHRMLAQPFELFRRMVSPGLTPEYVRTYAALDGRHGKFIGGIVIVADEAQWTYAWGTTDQSGEFRDLSTLLIGLAMQDAAAAGAEVFSLGASPLSHQNLRRFKREWGGEEHPIITYCWRQAAEKVDLHAGFQFAKAVVARSPLWLLKSLSGPAVKVLA